MSPSSSSSSPPQKPTTSLFQSLPLELRQEIYHHVFTMEPLPTHLQLNPLLFHGIIHTNLLLTCRAIYHEARHYPFAINDFRFLYSGIGLPDFQQAVVYKSAFLSALRPWQLEALRLITFHSPTGSRWLDQGAGRWLMMTPATAGQDYLNMRMLIDRSFVAPLHLLSSRRYRYTGDDVRSTLLWKTNVVEVSLRIPLSLGPLEQRRKCIEDAYWRAARKCWWEGEWDVEDYTHMVKEKYTDLEDGRLVLWYAQTERGPRIVWDTCCHKINCFPGVCNAKLS